MKHERTPPVTAELVTALKRKVETPEALLARLEPENPDLQLEIAKYKGKLELMQVIMKWHEIYKEDK